MHCTKPRPQGTPSGGLVSRPVTDKVLLLSVNYCIRHLQQFQVHKDLVEVNWWRMSYHWESLIGTKKYLVTTQRKKILLIQKNLFLGYSFKFDWIKHKFLLKILSTYYNNPSTKRFLFKPLTFFWIKTKCHMRHATSDLYLPEFFLQQFTPTRKEIQVELLGTNKWQ